MDGLTALPGPRVQGPTALDLKQGSKPDVSLCSTVTATYEVGSRVRSERSKAPKRNTYLDHEFVAVPSNACLAYFELNLRRRRLLRGALVPASYLAL